MEYHSLSASPNSAMRKCLFCQRSADSLEHAWPRWMTDKFRSQTPSEFHSERHGTQKSWRVLQPALTVRCVCRECNNGWMSQLESQAQPFLEPMLRGERCVLDLVGQATLAIWSVKTAMVLEALDEPDERAYTVLERQRLRTVSAVPWRSSVWLATSIDPSYFMSTKNRHVNPEDARDITGVSITMAFAHVVLQVFTIRVPETVGPSTEVTAKVRSGRWSEATVQVWPSHAPAAWPPAAGLNGEIGLNLMADRFSTADMGAGAITSLAV